MQMDKSKTANDEIGTLVSSFRNMLRSIRDNNEAEKIRKQKEEAPLPQQLIQITIIISLGLNCILNKTQGSIYIQKFRIYY